MISIFFSHLMDDPDTIAAARAVGLEGVDCSLEDLGLRPARRMRSFLQDNGLRCGAVFGMVDIAAADEATFRAGLDAARRMLDDADALGAANVMLVPGFATSEADKPRAAARMAQGLGRVAAEAAQAGIALSIENFSQILTPYATPEELLTMLDAAPGLGYTLDTGNFRCRGMDVLEALEGLLPRVTRVHIKDWGLAPRGAAAFPAQDGAMLYGAALGEGILPLDQVCHRLRERGFAGDWSVEMNNMIVTREDVERSVAYIRQRL